MNTLFTTYTHGDETPPFVIPGDVLVCNELAKEANTRYIDADLNRVFGLEGEGYEYQRAKEILEVCKDYDLVVDIHTTTALTSTTAIVSKKEDVDYARIFNPSKIVIIPMQTTLIANVKHGVAMEYSRYEGGLYATPKYTRVFSYVDFVDANPKWEEMDTVIYKGKTCYAFLIGAKEYNGKCFLIEIV